MAYCTPDDVRRLIPLVDQATMADSEVNEFISKAEAYVDGKLRRIYQVPFSPVPSIIRDVTAEYAAYLVLRTLYSQNTPNTTEFTKELKDSADKILDALVNGDLILDAPLAEESSLSVEEEQKIFTMEDITPPWSGGW